ncbi:hypothetical protein IFM47457_10755 [Aspergillus lentulus]|nr:hypothetical protein IFM47457_10755 [Aspergillus lentulus]
MALTPGTLSHPLGNYNHYPYPSTPGSQTVIVMSAMGSKPHILLFGVGSIGVTADKVAQKIYAVIVLKSFKLPSSTKETVP